MAATIRDSQLCDPAAAKAAAAPPGCSASVTPPQAVTRQPKILMPPPDDHDADDIAGWAGVVNGVRGDGPLSRPAGITPSPSERW